MQGVTESMAGRAVELSVCNAPRGEQTAYERLIGDAMRGDATLFARQDIVEEAWRIVDEALVKSGAVQPYARGTWGPEGADRLVRAIGGWVNPGSLGSDACA